MLCWQVYWKVLCVWFMLLLHVVIYSYNIIILAHTHLNFLYVHIHWQILGEYQICLSLRKTTFAGVYHLMHPWIAYLATLYSGLGVAFSFQIANAANVSIYFDQWQ